jgi:tellurite resistance protein TerC
LVLRGGLIALGSAALKTFDVAFLLFGALLIAAGAKVLRDALRGGGEPDVENFRSVRFLRRFLPVTGDYRGPRLTTREGGRLALTPPALVSVVVLACDVIFMVDSVPAVCRFGPGGVRHHRRPLPGVRHQCLRPAEAARALLPTVGRDVPNGPPRLWIGRHPGHGGRQARADILAMVGGKLVPHWTHGPHAGIPELPTSASSVALLAALGAVTLTSLYATRDTAAVGWAPGSETASPTRRPERPSPSDRPERPA